MATQIAEMPTLGEFIARAIELGCEYGTLEVVIEDGGDPVPLRFLRNRRNRQSVMLPNIPDSERLAPAVAWNFERMLEITTGLVPPMH